jgi:hypothetical protein
MAIIKKLSSASATAGAAPPAGTAGATGLAPGEATVPTFSFDNDGLAELIVEAWTNRDFRNKLLDRDPSTKEVTAAAAEMATKAVNARGFNLKRAVIITEDEHDNHYRMQTNDEVVFVLPDHTRLGTAFMPNSSLLDTARLLMSCTPNGI